MYVLWESEITLIWNNWNNCNKILKRNLSELCFHKNLSSFQISLLKVAKYGQAVLQYTYKIIRATSIGLNAYVRSLWTCSIMILFKHTCFIVFWKYVFARRSSLNDLSLVVIVTGQTMISFAKRNTWERSCLVPGWRLYKYLTSSVKFTSVIPEISLSFQWRYIKTTLVEFYYFFQLFRKYIRANESPFMTKDLHKAIMKRSKIRSKFVKSRNLSDRKNYTSQRNFCKKMLKNTKRTYFNNLDIRKVTDNRTSWKTVVALFSNKFSKSEKINLTEGNKTMSNDDELCRVFNNFFSKTVDRLKIPNKP